MIYIYIYNLIGWDRRHSQPRATGCDEKIPKFDCDTTMFHFNVIQIILKNHTTKNVRVSNNYTYRG